MRWFWCWGHWLLGALALAACSAAESGGSMSGSSSSSSSSSRWSLQDKKALITGGTKGIGRSAVKEFCELGAEVIFCARNADEVQAMESEFKGLGLLVHGFAADITQSGDRESLIRQASELFGGKLDILVNNVGTNIRKPSLEYTEEEYQRISDINLKAMFSLTSELHPLLKRAAAASGTAGGSSVVNISSVAGQTAINSGIVYAGTKAAINMYTEYWGCEWAKDNIRVNCVAPWYTRTPLVTEVLQNEAKRVAILDRTPFGRIAEPEEVSGVIAFLCMAPASYITAQIVSVDGGFLKNGYGFNL